MKAILNACLDFFVFFLFCQFRWKCCAFLLTSLLHSSLSMTKSLSEWPVLIYFSPYMCTCVYMCTWYMKTKVCLSISSDKPFSMVLSMLLMTKRFVSYVHGLPLAPICKKFSRLRLQSWPSIYWLNIISYLHIQANTII